MALLPSDDPNIMVYDTICHATQVRQSDADTLSRSSDLMIIVGGKHSSNTVKLFDVCKQNCRSYHIETADELYTLDLCNAEKIGITAGASTPAHIIKEVESTMSEIMERHDEEDINFAEALDQSFKKIHKGDVFVVGCSSSEIVGGHIGKDSSLEAARAVYADIAPVLAENGIWLAAQCCEHLNRAIIIEREAAEKYGWEEVCVVPRPHAGGSWATTCWKNFQDPVAVEEIRAHAGIDIGGTLIGMHLKRVAVPVRLSLSKIGEANILCARTRPKLIGGERAKYTEED